MSALKAARYRVEFYRKTHTGKIHVKTDTMTMDQIQSVIEWYGFQTRILGMVS